MRIKTSIEPLTIKTLDEMKHMKRMTTSEYFDAVVSAAKADGHLKPLEDIVDYILPHDYDTRIIDEYQFDTLFIVNFGSNEGIYIDAAVKGKFNSRIDAGWKAIGTIKTLNDDFGSMKIMGEACGILTFYASTYANMKIDLFTPDAELRRCVEWRMSREAERK